MKTITFLFATCLIPIFSIGIFTNAFGQKPTMELTFSAENNGQYVPLNSILIENLTQGGDTTLNAPDTVLSLEYNTGINDMGLSKNSFSVSQNYPNPFTDHTKINIYLPEKDHIEITILNILGSEVGGFEKTLNQGNHSFIFYSGKEKYYVLFAKTSNETRAIKMVSLNMGGQVHCKLVYKGYDGISKIFKSKIAITNFGFSIGDELKYTAYSFFGESSIIDSPSNNKTYTFEYAATSLPSVTTGIVLNIGTTYADVEGEITDLGGSDVTQHGHCWSMNSNPTINDFKTDFGASSTPCNFSSNLVELNTTTTYFVRAYATNSAGTAYGNELSFITGQSITTPIVTTSNVTNITQSSAVSGGNVTSNGGSSVTARGVCWSTSQNPTISGSHTTNGTGTGSYTSNVTGLTENTTYYIRAYAANSEGTAYGNELSFTTGQNITTPVVITSTVSNITQNSAVSGGNITSNGGANVTARGVCWSTSQNPTISGSHTTNGTGMGSYTSNLTNLTSGTTYYERAYASNSAGTSYGNQVSFTTISLPTVTTNAITNITQNSATGGGNVTSGGGATITARGVCWSTSQNPTISGSHTTNGTGTGTFTSNLTNLNTTTTYYVRAYATNSAGTAYGNQQSFATSQGGPVLTGPSVATGPFEITWTYDWPTIGAYDDHYELELSYSPNSGFQVFVVYPDEDRTSPYTETIWPEAIDIGLTSALTCKFMSVFYSIKSPINWPA